MYGKVYTAITVGIDGLMVTVEADVSDGLPVFEMVGFLSAEAKEAQKRVRLALRNSGFSMPVRRVTVNISPASIRKSGTGFDLPTAIALLFASEYLFEPPEKDTVVIGELQLSGDVRPVAGVLPMLLAAKEAGCRRAIVPLGNAREASTVSGLEIRCVRSLGEAAAALSSAENFAKSGYSPEEAVLREASSSIPIFEGVGEGSGGESSGGKADGLADAFAFDFSMIHGQTRTRRACEIAVAGRHNLLMVGPPGSGKSMIARCIPSILPPMSDKMRMELARIRSVCGEFSSPDLLSSPFRCPHHTISEVGLSGGGSVPRPGEISLAHGGVLFLDELPEFSRGTLEVLRQPMEEGEVRIVRQSMSCVFPADFMLVAAMNPCPCGYYPDRKRCVCPPNVVRRYLSRLSQPLLDRIDISIDVPRLSFVQLAKNEPGESSAAIRKRVLSADAIQKKRYQGLRFRFNSQLPAAALSIYAPLGEKETRHMASRYDTLQLTARGYHRLLRVARTIADLEGARDIAIPHLLEAEQYRAMDPEHLEI